MLRRVRAPRALGLAGILVAAIWLGAKGTSVAQGNAQDMALEIVIHADDTATVGVYGKGETETVVMADLAAAAIRASGGNTDIRVIVKGDEPLLTDQTYYLMHALGKAGFRVALVAEN